MDYRLISRQDGTDVVMEGRFTFTDYDRFAGIISLICERKSAFVCFDFSAVEFIDSAAIGLMLIAREKAEASGVRLAIRGASGKVGTIFKMAKFDQMFDMMPV